MKRHMANARDRLGQLSALASKTEADERSILAKAEARLEVVSASLERLRPGLDAAPDKSQDRYLDLVQERGQLHVIIAKAKEVLAQS